jgi:arylsulfatase A
LSVEAGPEPRGRRVGAVGRGGLAVGHLERTSPAREFGPNLLHILATVRVGLFPLALLIIPISAGFAKEIQSRPNIIFILADDLGVNDLGCYGRAEHRTPNLDAMAKVGVRFTTAYAACPVCSPTRAAILTGKHPARLHLTTFLPGRGDAPSQQLLHPTIRQQLPLEETTLAEYLKAAGYATACVGKWHLGGAGFGPDKQGFDVVHPGRAKTPSTEDEGGKGESDLTKAAVEFIAANRDRPFFLYLAHNSPHIPLGARKDLVEKYKAAFNPKYAAMIETLDASVGQVLKALDEHKLAGRTIVVFTSDNGGLHVPELKDDAPTHNTPYRAGKGFLYEGGIRVPLIVRGPGVRPAGNAVKTPVISTDWTPTMLAQAGVKPGAPLDGIDITPLLGGFDLEGERLLYWHVPHYTNQGSRPAGAIRKGDYKLIEHYEDDRAELFKVSDDPGEQRNLARTFPTTVQVMRSELEKWRRSVAAQTNKPNPAFDVALHRKLYIDTDVSTLKPAATAAKTSESLAEWRREIDRVVRKK